MRKLLALLILVCFVVTAPAQQKRTATTKARTTSTQKKQTTRKNTPTRKNRTTTTKKTATRKNSTPAPTVSGLKKEQQQVRNQIKEQERRLKANERDVNKRLQNLLVINNEIAYKRKTIDTIRHDIS